MKNYTNTFSKFLLLFACLTLSITSCQKDDTISQAEKLENQRAKSVQKIVSASDIPDVINFIKSKSNEELRFEITSSETGDVMMRNHEEDIILTASLQEQIKQVTNEYGKSNFTFNLIEQEDKEGIYFLNLVVKEYKDTFYMYIVNYVPDITWFKTFREEWDMASFTGVIYYYNSEGIYVAKSEMNLGTSTSFARTNPCPTDNNDTGGGTTDTGDPTGEGPGGTNGAGENGDGTTAGDGAADGSTNGDSDGSTGNVGGAETGDDIVCSCVGHNWLEILNGDCTCKTFLLVDTSGENRSMRDIVDCPDDTEEVCYQPNGDPCTNGCDTNGNCVEDPDEVENNNGVSVTSEPKAVMLLNSILSPDLTLSQQMWIAENPVNEKFALAIYQHFEDVNGFGVELNIEDSVLSRKIMDIQMGLENSSILNSVYEHNTFAKIMGRGFTNAQPVLFEEYQEAYNDIDPDNILSLNDRSLISTKILENYLLTKTYPVASLFLDT